MSPPTVAQVRAWLKVSTAAVSDEDLAVVLAAELANQGKACRWPDPAGLPADLVAAIYRRCARALAARGLPLGYQVGDEFGAVRLSGLDAEIERLEGYDRGFWFA